MQAPSYAAVDRAAHCAVTQTCTFPSTLTAEAVAKIVEETAPDGADKPMGQTAAHTCSNAEAVSLIGTLCRKARSLKAEKGKQGLERLLSQGILSPLLSLTFKGSSATVRLAAAKATCLLLPYSSPRLVGWLVGVPLPHYLSSHP